MTLIPHKYYLRLFFITVAFLSTYTSCHNINSEKRNEEISKSSIFYTCSMHPQIIRHQPGQCPICGMNLVRKEDSSLEGSNVRLDGLLNPVDEFGLSSVPLTTIKNVREELVIEALGNIQNDTRELATISAKISGRIEKLYVRYRYQMIMPGEKIMEIYSPEITAAGQNLLFILNKDSSNTSMLEAAKQRLLLMGMSRDQLEQLVKFKRVSQTVSVYSDVMGHIHEAGQETMDESSQMESTSTEPLSIHEGMYVQLGQRIFSLTNPLKAWAVLNIFPENQGLVKAGSTVKIIPEAFPKKAFQAKINFIEPFYNKGNKTLTTRVYFDNSNLRIPIGSQVRANISGAIIDANWLPRDAVLSLGLNEIVFVKTTDGFKAKKINTGIRQKNLIQVINGLAATDSVAINTRYLSDSESLIKINQ